MYNNIMKFEWDTDKSSSNKTKHGIDFEAAKELWLDENRIDIHVPSLNRGQMDRDRQASEEDMGGNLHSSQRSNQNHFG